MLIESDKVAGPGCVDSPEELRAILNTLAVGVIVLDEVGIIQSFTPMAERIFGYRDHEVVGKNIAILMASSNSGENGHPLEHGSDTGPKDLTTAGKQLKAMRKDGSTFPLELEITECSFRNKRRFVGVVRDVTLRDEIEDGLRQKNASLRLAWRGTGVGMWEWTVATGEIVFSDRYKELLGYAPNEFAHHLDEWTGHLHKNDKKAAIVALQAHISGRELYNVEYRLLTKSGEWRWFRANGQAIWDENGIPLRMAGSLADITESRRQQQALKLSEETIRSAMEAATIGMALVSPTGRWLMVNPALCELLGYDAADLLQTDFQSITHFADLTRSVEMMRQMQAGEITLHRSEVRCLHQSGRIVWVYLTASLVLGHEEESSYFVWQLQDVTERKKIAIMQDEFVSTVNHELRTPLSSVYGAIRMLKAKNATQLDVTGRRLLDLADQSCVRLSNLVNDILDLEKIAAGKMVYALETLDVGILVQDIVDRHLGLAERYEVSFRTELNVQGVFVTVDPNRFNQSLVNLLSNAAKYSRKADIVMIEVGIAEPGWVRVSVTDRGPGIPASFQPKMFERFAQADSSATRKVGGSGLGLNITKRIIEAFGGTVSFDTAEGEGTTFHFILPIETNTAGAA